MFRKMKKIDFKNWENRSRNQDCCNEDICINIYIYARTLQSAGVDGNFTTIRRF